MSKDVVKPGALSVAGRGDDKTVHGGVVRIFGVGTVTIAMALSPRWARILGTAGLQVIGVYVGASRIGVGCIRWFSFKSCAVGCLREAVSLPVVRQVSEIMIE